MLEFFIKKPVTTLMFVLFWVVMGMVAFPKMNVERMPPMDLPMVTTTLLYPGAGPAEIETQVVKPVEDAISKVSGIKKVTSQIYENVAYITTEFNLDESATEKQQEIKAQIDSIAFYLPEDLEQPVVRKLNIMQQNVMDIAITGADLRKTYDFVDNTLYQRITAIKGVADIEIFGGRHRAIRVFLDPQRMTAKGISITKVLESIKTHNLNVPSGKVETRYAYNTIRFIGEFATVKEIENMMITTDEGLRFKLSDIADVEDTAEEPTMGGRYEGEDALIVSIVKADDGNAVKIAQAVHNRMGYYKDLVKSSLGENAEIKVIYDSAVSINDEINSTLEGIVLGIALTVLVLLAFTKNWRSTVIAGVVIPVSLVSGFLFMDNSGFSINSMTLLAVASALGTLVANAIILIESALTLLEEGKTPEEAAVIGTKKVAVAVLAGTGTNIVVFLPLAFMEGIAGLFMNQFGMTVVYLTIMSLMFSFTLTPMMIAKFLKRTKVKNKKQVKRLGWFEGIFWSQVKHPWRWVIGAVVGLFMSSMLMQFVGNEFSPSADTGEVNIFARGPSGSTYEKSVKLAKAIEAKLSEFPEVAASSVKIGRRGLQNVSVNVTLVDESKRESDKAIAQKMVAAFADIPDADFQIKAGEVNPAGGSADIVMNILGDEDAVREKLAEYLISKINELPEVQSAMLAAQEATDEIQFIPNQNKMNQWGASNADVGNALRIAFYGEDTLKFKENGEEYPLIVEFSKLYKNADSASDILVSTKRGMTPITELGKLEYRPASRNIYRVNKVRQTEININLGKSTIGPVRSKVNSIIQEMQVPEGYDIIFGGMSEMQDETTGEMQSTFILATILTFILLAAIMNSLSHPFTIATSIITSFIGVFILLFLAGGTINISALLSVIMLVGLVVNNNIVLLEGASAKAASGEDPAKTLWAEFVDKYRMILMTTIAVVAGMLPQLISSDGSKVSMAAVLIGGMIGSMILTFILTPALFILIEKLRRFITGRLLKR